MRWAARCAVRSAEGGGGCVAAEATAMLKALGEGERVFDALVSSVVCNDFRDIS